MAHSLLLTGAKLGARVAVVTPPGFEPAPRIVAWARETAAKTGGAILVTNSLEEGLPARARFTRTSGLPWARRAEAAERVRQFESYRVTSRVFSMAASDAIFLHCLPAHRGEEVDADVIDSPGPPSSIRRRTACTRKRRCWSS